MGELLWDVRFRLWTIAHRPAMTVVAVLSLALGAQRASVLRLVLSQGLRLSLVGITIGIGLALIVGRLMASSLHGVSPADPLTLVIACLIVVSVGLAASYLPTLRATRVNPIEVLRYE